MSSPENQPRTDAGGSSAEPPIGDTAALTFANSPSDANAETNACKSE